MFGHVCLAVVIYALTMKTLPRPSRVLAKLRSGQQATCYKFNLGSYRAVEMAALGGYDCVWLCQEHVPTDWPMPSDSERRCGWTDGRAAAPSSSSPESTNPSAPESHSASIDIRRPAACVHVHAIDMSRRQLVYVQNCP